MPNMGMMQMGIGGFTPDGEPDTYTFTDATGQNPSTVVTSNTITVLDINITVTITITGGTYSKNGGAYTASAGTITKDDTVAVRVTTGTGYSTVYSATTTIGGIQGTFSLTTRAAISATVAGGTGTVIYDAQYVSSPASNMFIASTATAHVNNTGTDGWFGKDWGAGQSKWISSYAMYGGNSANVNWTDNVNTAIDLRLYGSNSPPFAWNSGTLLSAHDNAYNTSHQSSYHLAASGLTAQFFRYHWIGHHHPGHTTLWANQLTLTESY